MTHCRTGASASRTTPTWCVLPEAAGRTMHSALCAWVKEVWTALLPSLQAAVACPPALNGCPGAGLAQQEGHRIGPLLNSLVTEVTRRMPGDPVQFMIDTLTLSPEAAAQVCLPSQQQRNHAQPLHTMHGRRCSKLGRALPVAGGIQRRCWQQRQHRALRRPRVGQAPSRPAPVPVAFRTRKRGCRSIGRPSWRRCSKSSTGRAVGG